MPSSALVDPTSDEVMALIVASVPDITTEQLTNITEAYISFRSNQADILKQRQPKGKGSARNGKTKGKTKGKAGKNQNRATTRGGGAALRQLDTEFLATGRAFLNEDQQAGWDECAAVVDLSPPLAQKRKGQQEGTPPTAGSLAPPLDLSTIDGDQFHLSGDSDKPTIVQFGSYTCPIFRKHAPEMEAIQRKYSQKANFVLVYGYEAHPIGSKHTPANERDGVAVAQHTNEAERIAAAREAVNALKISTTVLIDEIDNDITNTWGGHPNAGYIISTDGTIHSTMKVIDPVAVEQYLDAL